MVRPLLSGLADVQQGNRRPAGDLLRDAPEADASGAVAPVAPDDDEVLSVFFDVRDDHPLESALPAYGIDVDAAFVAEALCLPEDLARLLDRRVVVRQVTGHAGEGSEVVHPVLEDV